MASQCSGVLETLTKAIIHYEDGDVMQLAAWVGLLAELEAEVSEDRRSRVQTLAHLVKSALRDGAPETFLETLSQGLDALSEEAPQEKGVWNEHGPMFLADTRNRLARAQVLVLALEEGDPREAIGELFRIFHTIKGDAGFLQRPDLASLAHKVEEALDTRRAGTLAVDEAFIDQLLKGIDELTAALEAPLHQKNGPVPVHSDEVLRIPVSKIDALVAQVGELLVALESQAGEQSPTVKKLGRALQQSSLRLRTEPIKDLMGRIKRGARDLAKDLGKSVEITLKGEDLELDRHLIASLEEPLMHIVRNSLDHGLETTEQRVSRSKPSTGHLTLEARRRGNRIEIGVTDDGRGLNTERIWTKALSKGLVTGIQPDDPRSVHALIFQPGFSTAETLTQVSGRGVGMDIVSSVVTAARGQVEIDSIPGRGLTVRLTFPLSTAVLEGLVVRLDNRRFIVPVTSALETLLVKPEQLRSVAGCTRVISLRGETFPVLSLRRALDGTPDPLVTSWGVVVETAEGNRHLLLVDEVESKKEVVIRSLGRQFQHLRGVSAATILAGGTLALVLDVDQLVHIGEQAQ